MRILVLGEGPNDLGRFDRNGLLTLPGVLPIFTGRLCLEVESSLSLEFKVLPWRSRRLQAHTGSGLHKKLELAAVLFGGSTNAIVGVVDRDGERNRDRAEQLRLGREAVLQHGLPCAAGLSVETLEATLLADEIALRAALGDPSIVCQPDPESLVSRDEKSDKNPKGRLQRLIAGSPAGRQEDFTSVYASIARHSRLAVLEERCPTGFGEFARQVREVARSLAP
ncbi:MAG TPA: hypothetical protein VMV10_23480 [Pirellulales bacterium]|nr:hypothetical protein [Pirellulales bacterium]